MRKRCTRYNLPGNAHELTFSCYKGRPFLSRNRTRSFLVEALIRSKEKQQFDLWAYVFMPNHVHLLLWPRNDTYSVSDILQAVKQSVARRALAYLRQHNVEGLAYLQTGQKHRPYRFWQGGGGYDRNITETETLALTVDYIHRNPVRRGLVETPEEWEWSSYGAWHGSESCPVPVDLDSFPSS